MLSPTISRCDHQASEMGTHLRCKTSYIGVKNDDPGCIWAFFRILGYHNFKRILPNNQKKQKPLIKTSKRKVKAKHHRICPPNETEEDPTKMNSVSVSYCCDASVGMVPKKSVKAKIKALLVVANVDKPRKLDLVQQSQVKVLEHNCQHSNAPTLMSLLKANPKPNPTSNGVQELINLKSKTRGTKKEEKQEVGVLDVFKVDQELFLKVLKNSPPRKPRLAKSRTFPSPNPSQNMPLSKVEHKHNEIWPVIALRNELKRSKSQKMGRSSSLKDSLDKYAPLFDSKINKEMKKGLSRSFKLSNEKEFELLGYHHLKRSCGEKPSFLEDQSCLESPQAYLETIKLESPKDFSGFGQVKGLVHPHLNRQSSDHGEQMAQMTTVGEACLQEDVHNMGYSIDEDSGVVPQNKHNFEDQESNKDNYFTEEFEYMKYILDLMGFTTREDPYGAWHSTQQPLDPSLFDGIELCCPFEPKSSEQEAFVMTTYNRKVLFDLINEALLYVHERSYVCYPKALTHKSHVFPIQKGKNQTVEEVWEFMCEYLRWRPEIDPVLNLAVPHELCEDGPGWMNLQADCERLALYLQDLILDDLLDEIVHC